MGLEILFIGPSELVGPVGPVGLVDDSWASLLLRRMARQHFLPEPE